MLKEVFYRFGLPEMLHSDQGSNFESRIFNKMCELLGIHKTRTTPYHARGNGLVERMNWILKSVAAVLAREEPENWDLLIPTALFAIRTSHQSSLKMSPYEALFHFEPRTILNLEFQAATPGTFSSRIVKDAELISRIIAGNLKKAQEIQKYYFDQRKPLKTHFQVGDTVQRIHVPRPGENRKLMPKWSGRYVVEKVLDNGVLELKDSLGRTRRENATNVSFLNQREERPPVALNPSTKEDKVESPFLGAEDEVLFFPSKLPQPLPDVQPFKLERQSEREVEPPKAEAQPAKPNQAPAGNIRPQRLRKRPDFYGQPIAHMAIDEKIKDKLSTLKAEQQALKAQLDVLLPTVRLLIDYVRESVVELSSCSTIASNADFQACINVSHLQNMHHRISSLEKSMARIATQA